MQKSKIIWFTPGWDAVGLPPGPSLRHAGNTSAVPACLIVPLEFLSGATSASLLRPGDAGHGPGLCLHGRANGLFAWGFGTSRKSGLLRKDWNPSDTR